MALRPVQVNIKALDHPAVGRFWARALGWTVQHSGTTTYVGPPGDFVWPDPVAVGIDVVPVPELPAGNRAHLELAVPSATLIDRLGAAPTRADPEGNEFLVPSAIHPGTGPIAAIAVDCADPPAMARFWGAAIDWPRHEVTGDRAVFRSARGGGPFLEFRRTPGAPAGPDRIHLDLMPYPGDDKAAEVARLRTLGATDLDLGQGDVPWTCMTDPEGHEFCVLAQP